MPLCSSIGAQAQIIIQYSLSFFHRQTLLYDTGLGDGDRGLGLARSTAEALNLLDEGKTFDDLTWRDKIS